MCFPTGRLELLRRIRESTLHFTKSARRAAQTSVRIKRPPEEDAGENYDPSPTPASQVHERTAHPKADAVRVAADEERTVEALQSHCTYLKATERKAI